jgi:hypothetical protein
MWKKKTEGVKGTEFIPFDILKSSLQVVTETAQVDAIKSNQIVSFEYFGQLLTKFLEF